MKQPITIVSIGPKHDPDIIHAIERYEKRLKPFFEVKWRLLPYSKQNDDSARREETKAISDKIAPTDFVVLLDERGVQFTSHEFSQHLIGKYDVGFHIVFVIGGAYGVDDAMRERANVVMSLSRMVLPHQLARLILIEQIYRGVMIAHNHPYHHQ